MFLVSVFVWFPGRPSVAARDHRQRSCSHLEEQLSSLEVPITPLYSYILIYLYILISYIPIFRYSHNAIWGQCQSSRFKYEAQANLYATCKTFGFSGLSWPSVVQVLGQPDQEPQLCVRPREGEHRRLLPQCRRPDLHGRLQHVRPPAWYDFTAKSLSENNCNGHLCREGQSKQQAALCERHPHLQRLGHSLLSGHHSTILNIFKWAISARRRFHLKYPQLCILCRISSACLWSQTKTWTPC